MENKILKKYKAVTKRVETFFKTDNEMQKRKNWNHHQKEIWINRVNKCPTCNVKLTKKNCTKEHIHPLVLGGTESDDNITPMCQDCNQARNSVMTKFLGTTSHNELRSNWPSNQAEIYKFAIWCYISLTESAYQIPDFTDLDEMFVKTREIDINRFIKDRNPQHKSKLKKLVIGSINKIRSLSGIITPSRPVEKIDYTCKNQSCGKIFKLPTNFESPQKKTGYFRCPHCSEPVDISWNQKESDIGEPELILSAKKTETKNSDNKFDLQEWLNKNWGVQSEGRSNYVKLKVELLEHENSKTDPRNLRQLMFEDFGIKKSYSVDKIIQFLDDLSNENKDSQTESKDAASSRVTSDKSSNQQVNIVKNLNSSSGVRLPVEPNSLLEIIKWLRVNHLKFKMLEDCRDELKNAELIGKSRVIHTLKAILYSLQGEVIAFQKLKTSFHEILPRIVMYSDEKIILGIQENCLSMEFGSDEAYISGVKEYFTSINNIPSDDWLKQNWEGKNESYNAFKQHLVKKESENGGERKVREIMKQDFEIPKSWQIKRIIRYLNSRYTTN